MDFRIREALNYLSIMKIVGLDLREGWSEKKI